MITPKVFQQFPHIISGFSTIDDYSEAFRNKEKRSVDEVKDARVEFLKKLWNFSDTWVFKKEYFDGQNNYVFLNQVHGDGVIYIKDAQQRWSDADWMLTDTKGLALCVHTADCVPILIYVDQDKPMIAVLHSGRRSTEKNIVSNLFRLLAKESVNLDNVYVYIGPSACKDCYEFGDEVYELFATKYIAVKDWKKYLDTAWVVMDQILAAGVAKKNIERQNSCTICNNGFFSYRKSGATNRLMFGVIGIRL